MTKSESRTQERSEKSSLSFRAQLILFGVGLVLVVAVPSLVVELPRPWDALGILVNEAKAALGGVESGFEPSELQRMNRLALAVSQDADPGLEDPLIWTFNMMVMEQRLLTEDEMKAVFQEEEVEVEGFDYAKVQKAWQYWSDKFAGDPELLELFRKYKQRLIQSKENVKRGGFNLEDIYVMVDDGKTLAFLLDGTEWYDGTYPGLTYDVVENDSPYFRDYLEKGPGFSSNPMHYYYGIFPKFDTDKWGTWFSVTYAVMNEGIYNNFAIDFEATAVRSLMWKVGGLILTIIVLVALIIGLLAHKLTALISAPLTNLVAGAEAVIAGDYDHVVPDAGSRDFKQMIEVFNQMTGGLKERLNMKQTLEKLLSKELAEQVASHGLVLGGQNVNITNLFTDFAGFSSITYQMKPEEVVAMLNEYFSALIPIIKKWGGLPDKYIGDAIVAIFGAPVVLDNHAERAVACAVEMQLTMRRINERRQQEGKVVLEMRVGLNSGDVIAGAIGSDLKLEYTTIGETTNLANRMESVCQIGHVLIAQGTYEQIKDIFFDGAQVSVPPQHLQVKGYAEPVAAYNIYVADLKIAKNPNSTGPKDFYLYEPVERKIRLTRDLSPEEQAGFQKIVEIDKT